MAAERSLRDLLARGAIRWSSSVPAPALAPRPDGGFAELRGRLVELCGEGATALTTFAVGLVRQAQRAREPAAWLCCARNGSDATFFPPDVAAAGVDLAALAVVRVPALGKALEAADCLLRSGGFGPVVLDLAAAEPVPLAAQTRLSGLARQHDAALVCLSRIRSGGGSAFGSLASLRAESRRRRVDDGVFECALHVVKDKRRGRLWQHTELCDGALGLR
jgi:recombination protein RecA